MNRELSRELGTRVEAIAGRFRLSEPAIAQLVGFCGLLALDPRAPTSIRDPARVVDDHLADSLVALELPGFPARGRLLDIGSGAGLPGLPLAIAREGLEAVLLESNSRKAAFIDHAIESCEVRNAVTVAERAETWRSGFGSFDLVVVRAVASLEVVAEYAAPFLRLGGTLIAWRGKREAQVEIAAEKAAKILGMSAISVHHAQPHARAEHRYLHLMSKVMETPERFPRRPGIARKRPLAEPQPARQPRAEHGGLSDRPQR